MYSTYDGRKKTTSAVRDSMSAIGKATNLYSCCGVKAPEGQKQARGKRAGQWGSRVKDHNWLYFIHDQFHVDGDASGIRNLDTRQPLFLEDVKYPPGNTGNPGHEEQL